LCHLAINFKILYTFHSLAVENEDYEVPAPFEVTFDTMSTNGSLACVNITILQDFALEGDHAFTVHLLPPLSPDVVTIASPVNTTVVIADDESKCVYVCTVCAYYIFRKYLHVCVKIVHQLGMSRGVLPPGK